MAIRLLAVDIDGTLTNQTHTVSDANTEAIRAARQAGVFVTLATGRGHLASREILRAIDVSGPSIHYGGAWIIEEPGGATLYFTPLTPEVVSETLALAKELRVIAQLYQENIVLVEKANPFTQRYVQKFNLPMRIEPHICNKKMCDVPKILILTAPEDEERILTICSDRLGEQAEITRSQLGFIEINRLGVNKASGLAFVADMLGIQQEETAAIGDSFLDADMLQWAGEGVCVDNAAEAVKQWADVIVPSCDDDGVAYYIRQYLL